MYTSTVVLTDKEVSGEVIDMCINKAWINYMVPNLYFLIIISTSYQCSQLIFIL